MKNVKYINCEFLNAPKVSTYTEQAEAWLVKHNITLTIAYRKTETFFDEDNDATNIFQWFLKREGTSASGKFGDSIQNTKNNKCPTAYDILSCLTKYEPGDFENFCSDFGYSTDNIKARKTYKAVKNEWDKMTRILINQTMIEELQEIN